MNDRTPTVIPPCPFCGHPSEVHGIEDKEGWVVWAECPECRAKGPSEETVDAALGSWRSVAPVRHYTLL